MGRWSRVVGEAFLDWLNAPKNLRWLDVGCGKGAFTEELIARCAPAAVTAIDPSGVAPGFFRSSRAPHPDIQPATGPRRARAGFAPWLLPAHNCSRYQSAGDPLM